MNYIKTLILIPILIFQLSGVETNISYESFNWNSLYEKVSQDSIKETQSQVKVNITEKNTVTNNKRTPRKNSVMSHPVFSVTQNAELF